MQNKGQGVIAEVFLVWAAIFLAMFIFIIVTEGGGGVQEQEVSESIDLKVSDIRKRNVVSNTLNDKMWRQPSINQGEYENITAYKVITYYFSTPGNTMRIYENQKSMNTVKTDLEKYLTYKMEKYWKEGSLDTNYYLDLRNASTVSQRPENITVQSYNPSGAQKKVQFRMSKTNGEKIWFTMFTDKTQPIFGTDLS